MRTILKTRYAVCFIALIIVLLAAVPGYPAKSNEWVVKAGDSLVLKIYNIKRIAIGDPEIIDATSVSKNEVLINGKKEGITTLHIWTSAGWVPYRIKVITKDKITPEELGNIINFIKDFSVKIYQDKIVLNGYAPDKASFQKAEMIAGSFYSGVVNLIEIKASLQESLQQDSEGVPSGMDGQAGAGGKNEKYSTEFKGIFQKMKGMENINVLDKDGTIVLIGEAENQHIKAKAESIIKTFYPNCLNLIEVKNPVQILVEVKIIEVNRNIMDELGISWGSGLQIGSLNFQEMGSDLKEKVGTDLINPLVGTTGSKAAYSGGISMVRLDPITATLKFLETNGDAKILASPTLVTYSGENANINIGGEIPFPISTETEFQTTQSIEWKKYGIQMEITPLVDENDNIKTKIKAVISDVDDAHSVNLTLGTMPAFSERRTETTLSSKDGETYFISGLTRNKSSVTQSKVPLLGSIPFIGKLFTKETSKVDNIDLIVLVKHSIIRGEKTYDSEVNKKIDGLKEIENELSGENKE